MNFNVNDIEVFITTHNRASYLVSAIESILNQTAGVKSITILDNESSDNTEEIVKLFENQGVKYIKTFGFLGNFNKAQEIASKEYVMLFHDDDILDPNYLEIALKALNKYRNISLIATRYTELRNDDVPSFADKILKTHYLFNAQKDFAEHMYFMERIAYATAIYRTEDFKNTPLEYEKYNKFNDWPFMVKMAKYGNSILLDDPNLFYARCHDTQDTWTSTNSPSVEQIINWDKCFYDAMRIKFKFRKFIPFQLFLFFKQKKLDSLLKIKSMSYLEGKYTHFLPDEMKNLCSFEEVLKLAKENGLFVFTTSLSKLPDSFVSKLNSSLKLHRRGISKNIKRDIINVKK